MLHFTYRHIHEIETITIFVIIVASFSICCFTAYLMGLGLCCLMKRFRNKNSAYTLTVNFKNAIGGAEDDSIFFSEILPSSDSLTRGGSLISSRTNSTASTLSEGSTKTWFPMTIKCKKIGWKQKAEIPPASVYLSVKFVPLDEETNQNGKLHISVKKVVSLPTKDYPRYTEAYLILEVIRAQRTIKGKTENKVYEYRTRNFRNTRDIEMEEHFVVEAKKNDIKNLSINVKAYDQDIYTKPSELASAVISLSPKCKEICVRREGLELMSHLKQVPKNVGNILIGLSYLPTSQRLSVNIVRAANLPNIQKEKNTNLYAQIFLLTGVTGRSLKRKKLDFTTPENDPCELNGNLSFDITPNQLENVTLLIILYKKNPEELPFQTIESARASLDFEKTHKSTSDHCFGSVAIGKLVKSNKGKKTLANDDNGSSTSSHNLALFKMIPPDKKKSIGFLDTYKNMYSKIFASKNEFKKTSSTNTYIFQTIRNNLTHTSRKITFFIIAKHEEHLQTISRQNNIFNIIKKKKYT